MSVRWLLACVVVACLGVTACSREDELPESDEKQPLSAVPTSPARTASSAKGKRRSVREVKSSRSPKSSEVDFDSIVAAEDRTDLTPSDRKTLSAIEKALEDEDLKAARAVAAEALRATSPEVRSECVDMLGWFDAKTLAELTPFLSDPDTDVAENALSTWTRALGEIENEKMRCETVEGVMKVLKNEDTLESLLMEVNDCDETLVMQTVVNLIGSDNEAAAKVAREHYEFMTGDAFTTVEDAEKWLRENNPEEGN